MFDERKDLRLARANRPIRTILGKAGKVWFYVPNDLLDRLAQDNPNHYLSELETWRNALWNQDYYCINVVNGTVYVHIACSVLSGGKPVLLEIVGVVEDDYIRLTDVLTEPRVYEWKAIKREARKFYKGRSTL